MIKMLFYFLYSGYIILLIGLLGGRISGNVPDGFYHLVLAVRPDLAVLAVGCNHESFVLSFHRISYILRQPFFHRHPG